MSAWSSARSGLAWTWSSSVGAVAVGVGEVGAEVVGAGLTFLTGEWPGLVLVGPSATGPSCSGPPLTGADEVGPGTGSTLTGWLVTGVTCTGVVTGPEAVGRVGATGFLTVPAPTGGLMEATGAESTGRRTGPAGRRETGAGPGATAGAGGVPRATWPRVGAGRGAGWPAGPGRMADGEEGPGAGSTIRGRAWGGGTGWRELATKAEAVPTAARIAATTATVTSRTHPRRAGRPSERVKARHRRPPGLVMSPKGVSVGALGNPVDSPERFPGFLSLTLPFSGSTREN